MRLQVYFFGILKRKLSQNNQINSYAVRIADQQFNYLNF